MKYILYAMFTIFLILSGYFIHTIANKFYQEDCEKIGGVFQKSLDARYSSCKTL